ncbi:MAG TPA: YihY/virulence factor BrkB family protein [Vicinamibacterales bacterium]|nr:YihY/virulence factor BrkB family protein [Vicinamibacterales bacterium]
MGRTLRLAWRATRGGVVEFYNSNNPTYSASIAYYALLSFPPFTLIVLSLVRQFAIVQTGSERAATDLIARALPSNFDFLSAQVIQLERAPVPLTIVGTILTIWASMGVFGAITAAVDHAWGTEKPRSYLRHQMLAFLMMLTAGAVFAISVLLMGVVHFTAGDWFSHRFPGLIAYMGMAAHYWVTPVVILAMALLFRFAPNTRVRFRDVWFGAVLAGVLWRFALAGFSWYMDDVSRFSIHGSIAAVVAFLVWVYLSAVILLYGVEVTACYARARAELEKE